jgi:ribonucleotide reductase beta subunit family protein with ferritin-like domain
MSQNLLDMMDISMSSPLTVKEQTSDVEISDISIPFRKVDIRKDGEKRDGGGSSEQCSLVERQHPDVEEQSTGAKHSSIPGKGYSKKTSKKNNSWTEERISGIKQEIEPILTPDEHRYVMFPIAYQDIWSLYKKAVDSFWKVEDVDLSKDLADWEALHKDEKYFITMVLAFFSSSDGIVNENLSMRFSNEVQCSEVRAFYSFQNFMETIHCVTGNTKILTNQGYIAIQELLHQTVHIWNGHEFSEVMIKYTGEQEIYLVELSNGMSLECTPGHKWLIYHPLHHNIERIETKDLIPCSIIAPYHIPVLQEFNSSINMPNPFAHGFYCGNRTFSHERNDVHVPINESIFTKLRWLEGYVEATGNVYIHSSSENIQQYSIQLVSCHLSLLKDIQLMLSTMGITTSIRKQTEHETQQMILEEQSYVWYCLYVSTVSLSTLLHLGFSPCWIVSSTLRHEPKEVYLCTSEIQVDEQQEVDGTIRITHIQKISEKESTYCFEEPLHHTGIFNGILTCQSEMYSQLIDTYIRDADEKRTLFQATQHFPFIKKKADWAKRWIMDHRSLFSTRLVAFAIVEGIFFSSSFAAIFWLKQRNILPGLCLSNEYISRDEALHVEHAVMLYHKLKRRMTKKRFIEMMKEAVDIEIDFICEAIPCRLIGMNHTLMSDYIRFVADRLCVQLGYDKIYHVSNPLPFMELISVEKKTNFFEHRVSEYSLASKSFDDNIFNMIDF